MAGSSPVFKILSQMEMTAVYQRFVDQHVDSLGTCKGLTDNELTKLGIATIGDRVRFRQLVDHADDSHMDASVTRVFSRPTVVSEERQNLFAPSRVRQSRGKKKPLHTRTWTANFMCLSKPDQMRVPNHTEKVLLHKAGLGLKKVTFYAYDDESAVHSKLLGVNGFPKLSESGGFELMHCLSNCRQLEPLKCRWDVQQLKNAIGGQSRIYIRPLQRELALNELETEQNECQLKVKCDKCQKEINLQDFRDHMIMETCSTVLPNESIQSSCSSSSSVNHVYNDIEEFPTDLPELTGMGVETEPSVPVMAGVTHVIIMNEEEVLSSDDQVNIGNMNTGSIEKADNDSMNSVNQVDIDNVNSFDQVDSGDMNSVDQVVDNCIKYIHEMQITEPISALQYIQSKLVTGRPLDIGPDDLETGISGETSFIAVDRNNILSTAIDEISGIANLRLTLDVNFYGEVAEDYGGPRREFFTLVLRQIKDKYLEPLREWASHQEMESIGKILCLSLLQNGRQPRVFSPEMLEELFGPNPRPVLASLKSGMNALGFCKLIEAHPFLCHLLTPVTVPVTVKKMTQLLKPEFSPTGSNRLAAESSMYQQFIKYLREVAGGRRGNITLGSILRFATGAEEEPPLGFSNPPSISFHQRVSLIPTANTCICKLILSLPLDNEIPIPEILFGYFDYAFSSTYFGLV